MIDMENYFNKIQQLNNYEQREKTTKYNKRNNVYMKLIYLNNLINKDDNECIFDIDNFLKESKNV